MQKVAEAYWQALLFVIFNYGMTFVAGLPNVMDIIQTDHDRVALLSETALQAEYHCMKKPQMMQEVRYLVE